MKLNNQNFSLGALIAGIVLPDSALAYIGPGAGLSAIGTVVAVASAFLLLVIGFVWYPVKRILRRGKVSKNKSANEQIDQKN